MSGGEAAAIGSVQLIAMAMLVVLACLGAVAFTPDLRRTLRRRRSRIAASRPRQAAYDPGRERRAEVKARRLLRSVVGEEAFAMYSELGFIRVDGGHRGYGYLLYPHRSIIAFDQRSGALLNEYCVGFPDASDPAAGTRLPDSDDVLAKWMALQGDERRLIADANMHLPGRHVDPGQVRRDLLRLRAWESRRRRLPQ